MWQVKKQKNKMGVKIKDKQGVKYRDYLYNMGNDNNDE